MLALRLLATYANLPVIGSSAISVLLPPALPSRPRGFLLQAKTPLGRTTCPSCNNRCADGGQTGLRVHLDAISIVVLRDDQAELDRYWNALLEGGGKAQACGWLIDRFGLRWQIVPAILDELMRDKDPARSKRVTDALLRMVKLDIAALEKAYRS